MKIPTTRHGLKRMQQRGIPPMVADLVWQYGESIPLPGHAKGIRIPRQLVEGWMSDLTKILHIYEKSRDVWLVVDKNESMIITVYSKKDHKHRQRVFDSRGAL